MSKYRLSELNKKAGFFQKLGHTIALLLVGILVTPLYCFGLALTNDPVLRWMLRAFLEALVPFYLLLILFVWWRPNWLSRWYSHAEARLLWVGRTLCAVVFALLLIAGLCSLIASFFAH